MCFCQNLNNYQRSKTVARFKILNETNKAKNLKYLSPDNITNVFENLEAGKRQGLGPHLSLGMEVEHRDEERRDIEREAALGFNRSDSNSRRSQ